MGHLVELPTKRAPVRALGPGHSAAILFFTGVRYGRMEESTSAKPCDTIRRKRKAPAVELQA